MTDVTRSATAASDRPSLRQQCGVVSVAHEVLIADRQSAVQIDAVRYRELVQQVLTAEGAPPGTETAVMFVDAEQMAGLNEAHMGHVGPTDVLAFPLDLAADTPRAAPASEAQAASQRTGVPAGAHDRGDAPTETMLVGDVVVCPAVAAANAAAGAGSRPGHDGSVTAEIDLLVVHGVLHLLGMDHADHAAQAAMRARESEHLGRLWSSS